MSRNSLSKEDEEKGAVPKRGLSPLAFALAAILIALVCFQFGQKFDAIGNFGDDKYYVLMAAGFDKLIFDIGVNEYRLQRMIPPGLVHYTLKFTGQEINLPNIRMVWSICNIILSGLIGLLWAMTSDELNISLKGKWLGLVAIFLNYQMIKYIPFISISTDLFAYTITLALVYFYLRNDWPWLCVLILIGSFCWPTILYTGTALLLFPKDNFEEEVIQRAPFKLNWVLAFLLVLPLVIYMGTVFTALQGEKIYRMGIFSMGSNRPLMGILPLSMAITVVYLFVGLGILLNSVKFFRWRYWKGQVNLLRIVLAVVMIVVVKMIIHSMASTLNARPVMYLITNLIIVSIMQPGAFLVSHAVFFGPVFLFLPLLWKDVCEVVHQYGVGLVICVMIAVLFSLDSESRKQMNTWPLILPFLIKAIDRRNWDRWHWIALVGLMIFASKVWYFIEPLGWSNAMEFPAQSFYMTMGPWMAHSMYAFQGVCVLVAAVVLYIFYVHGRKAPDEIKTK